MWFRIPLRQKENFNFWHVHTLRSVFVNSSTKTGSYPHEFLCRTNCSACADYQPCIRNKWRQILGPLITHLLEYCKIRECYAVTNAFMIRNMYSLLLYMKCNSRKINRPTKNMTKIVTLLRRTNCSACADYQPCIKKIKTSIACNEILFLV
jgi:hypothetical protein